MTRWKTADEKEVIKHTVTSKRTAEIFIKNFMERNKRSREQALKKLKELGIEPDKLPD